MMVAGILRDDTPPKSLLVKQIRASMLIEIKFVRMLYGMVYMASAPIRRASLQIFFQVSVIFGASKSFLASISIPSVCVLCITGVVIE